MNNKGRLTHHCTCGASFTIHAPAGAPTARLMEIFMEIFKEAHQGKGHKPCNSATASRARRKEEVQEP